MMDDGVLFLRDGDRVAFIPPDYKEEVTPKLNKKASNILDAYNYKEEFADKIFDKLIDYLKKEHVPVVVLKAKGNRIKVIQHNSIILDE